MISRRGLVAAVSAAAFSRSSLSGEEKAVRSPLAVRIDRLIEREPLLARAHLGIRAIDARGRVIYERNARSWFTPASNTKLYSTALALTRLGPGYRVRTRLEAQAAPDDRGVLAGDIRLVGVGDPSLSGRAYPYDRERSWDDAVPGIERLADAVAERGVRRVAGRVLGDDTAFPWEPYPDGWAIDDPLYEYGAPVSALTVQDNALRLEIRPGGAPGEAPLATIFPEAGQVTLVNEAVTGAPGSRRTIRLDRLANTTELRISGSIPAGGSTFSGLLAVDDPALAAARLLTEALRRRGVRVDGEAEARHRTLEQEPEPAWPVELAAVESAPLGELAQVVNKVSQNLHAELLLRLVSVAAGTGGGREASLVELRRFLEEDIGLPKDEVQFEDGSGLSRLTLLTPFATTSLLDYMANSPAKEAWIASLPVGGVDGSLRRRFVEHAANPRVRAKTGTLSHVSALGGYLEHRRLGRLAFTVVLNQYNGTASEGRAAMDKIVTILLE